MMLIEARDVRVDLAPGRVIGPASLAVAPGEVVGLLGPNGAGKSTLMRALAGLLDCAGAVVVDGRPLAQLGARARAQKLAFLPQARAIGWSMAASRVVDLGRLPWRAFGAGATAGDTEICAAAMAMMDVTHLAERPATELSGGEQARVLAARAIAQATPLLIADEPASGLDPAHQIAMMAAFRDLAGQGRGVLVSLHDLTLAARWCDRVVVMDGGRIVAEGAPADVLDAGLLRRVYGISAHVAKDADGLVLAPVALVARDAPPGDAG